MEKSSTVTVQGVTRQVSLIAIKTLLVEEFEAKFPWVEEISDKILNHPEGKLYHIISVKWDNSSSCKSLYEWLFSQGAENYKIVEGCYPTYDEGCVGEWDENPWIIQWYHSV